MPNITNYNLVRDLIEDGDILAFCDRNWISFNSGGPCYHIGIAKWARNGHDSLLNIQARAFRYTSASALSGDVRLYPGVVNVLRPTCSATIRRQAAAFALEQTGADRGYGYSTVIRASLLQSPILHFVFGRQIDPNASGITPENAPKDCAQLAECCYRRAGFPIVSRRKHDAFVLPNSYWDSPVVELVYAGLFIPPPAEVAA